MIYEDGEKRYIRNRLMGIVDKAIHIEDPLYTDHMAKEAELFQHALHPTWIYEERFMPDKGWDFLLLNGKKIDCKWSKEHSNNLITPKGYVFKSDYYTFVTGPSKDDLVERGWATRAEFISAPVVNLGRGTYSYIVYQRYLHPMSEFPNE